MMKKTIIKTIAAALAAALCLGNGITAFAAPELMPSGAIFDAQYYAQNYPDVVAALGTERDALYGHYVTFGWSEGRLAFEGDTPFSSNLVIPPAADTATEQLEIIGVQGVLGGNYELPTWGYYEPYGEASSGVDRMITMKVYSTADEYWFAEDMAILAPYTTPGYEWRFIHFDTLGAYEESNGRWWAEYFWSYDVEGSKNWVRASEGENYRMKFTVTQDGVEYTECKSARAYAAGAQTGEISRFDGVYVLLPTGYRGKVYFTIKGAVNDGTGNIIENDSAAVTFLF